MEPTNLDWTNPDGIPRPKLSPLYEPRQYLADRLTNCDEWEADGDDDTPHADRDALDTLWAALDILDTLAQAVARQDYETAELCHAAALRLTGFVPCLDCGTWADDLDPDDRCPACAEELDDDELDDDELDDEPNPFGGALDR